MGGSYARSSMMSSSHATGLHQGWISTMSVTHIESESPRFQPTQAAVEYLSSRIRWNLVNLSYPATLIRPVEELVCTRAHYD